MFDKIFRGFFDCTYGLDISFGSLRVGFYFPCYEENEPDESAEQGEYDGKTNHAGNVIVDNGLRPKITV